MKSKNWQKIAYAILLLLAAALISVQLFTEPEQLQTINLSLQQKRITQNRPSSAGDMKQLGTKPSELQNNQNKTAAANYSAISIDGNLTTKAIEDLQLSDEEISSITKVIAQVMDEVAADFVSRTKLTESRSIGSNDSHTYFTVARVDSGETFLNKLSGHLVEILGEDRGLKLAGKLESFDYAGGLGRYDIETELIRENGTETIKQHFLDPNNGRLLQSTESTASAFRERFGDLFELGTN